MAAAYEEERAPGLEEADVVTKYKMGAEMLNRALQHVASLCVEGASVLELCEAGDAAMEKEVGTVFNKKVEGQLIPKGIAFPTCININEILFNYSPLKSDKPTQLKAGDVVKIDMGLHLDGYIVVNAHTVVVGASAAAPVTGRKADAILAAYYACEVAARLIKPGNKSSDVTAAIQKVVKTFNCNAIEDIASYQMEHDELMSEKSINQNPSEAARKDIKVHTFEANEVYAIDVLVSTGEGKARQTANRATVFRPTGELYQLKLKHARQFFGEVQKKTSNKPMAITLRGFENEAQTKMGVKECVEHGLIQPMEVMADKEGEYVAQFRVTTLLMPNGNLKITTGGFDPATCKSEFSIEDEEIKKILSQNLSAKAGKKKKKNNKKKADEAASAGDAN